MTLLHSHSPWYQDGWLDEVQAWVQQVLQAQGYEITGPLDQMHIYVWSTVIRIPTNNGTVFFKATALYSAHEAALVARLSQLQPESTPHLIASDPERGWMIMTDAGQRLREQIQQNLDLKYWETLLPIYAQLQQVAAPHADALIALGVPSRKLIDLPARYREIVAQENLFRIGTEDELSAADYQRLRDLAPVFEQKCAQLAEYGIPETIQHGDLHDGNIFYNAPRYAFYDWGDCSISHPFFSMRVSFVSIENRYQLPEGAPDFDRLRHTYLSAWHAYGDDDRLMEAFHLAEELWPVASLLSWYETVRHLDGEERQKYAYTLPSLGQEFLGSIKA